jgi:hypothetical protein
LLGVGTFGGPWGTGGPHILCPYTATGTYCSGSFQVAFANPVTDLQFYFTGDNTTAALSVEAFLNGSSLGTLAINGDGVTSTAQLVNLSKFGQISAIKVTGVLADGFGYDDFSFVAVPEPSTWAMMLLGFGMVGVAVRRRKAAKPLAA